MSSSTNTNTNTNTTLVVTTSTNSVVSEFVTSSSSNQQQQQACAACKHQRRKCASDCLLAPFFPANQSKVFLHAHKLFGVKRITNALQAIPDPTQRTLAAHSIIAHSNARAADPVGGCLRIICELQRQIDLHTNELGMVQNQLAVYQSQDEFLYKNGGNNTNGIGEVGSYDDVSRDVDILRMIDEKELSNLDGTLWIEKDIGIKKEDELEPNAKDEDDLKAASSLVSLITQ